MKMMLFLLILCLPVSLMAQRNEIKSDHIRTLRVLVNGNWDALPIIELGSSDRLDISFDDMSHEYRRYRYKIEHCEYDWKVSEGIFNSDFLTVVNDDEPIETYKESLNTTVLYTHYSFKFPNEKTSVSKSGNYRITIFDDDNEETVCTVCFSVVESNVAVTANATTNTDIDWNKTHQQITFKVNPQSLPIHDARSELKTVVLQNGRWDNAVVNPNPDYVTPSDIQWMHCSNLIFNGGNEYRKFELITTHYGTMGIDNIRWFSPYYHATLLPVKDRRNYVYDEDRDGAYYVRTSDYTNNDYEADYILVHFNLAHAPETQGDIYINGNLTNDWFYPECKMTYNSQTKLYEGTMLLKQGYYNYQYLFVPASQPDKALTETVEGDFFQTENRYTILVYYCPQGGRYDRLVGVRDFKFAPAKQ